MRLKVNKSKNSINYYIITDTKTSEGKRSTKIFKKLGNEQEILKREKELSNSAMYSMMGDATKDLFAGIFNSPEFKEEMSKKIKEGFNKK